MRLPPATRLVVLVDGQPCYERLLDQVSRRLREELVRLEVEVRSYRSGKCDQIRCPSS